jgi:hypothetical protein
MGGPGQVEVLVEYGPAGNILDVYIGEQPWWWRESGGAGFA